MMSVRRLNELASRNTAPRKTDYRGRAKEVVGILQQESGYQERNTRIE